MLYIDIDNAASVHITANKNIIQPKDPVVIAILKVMNVKKHPKMANKMPMIPLANDGTRPCLTLFIGLSSCFKDNIDIFDIQVKSCLHQIQNKEHLS